MFAPYNSARGQLAFGMTAQAAQAGMVANTHSSNGTASNNSFKLTSVTSKPHATAQSPKTVRR
jgi:hypothetical protein